MSDAPNCRPTRGARVPECPGDPSSVRMAAARVIALTIFTLLCGGCSIVGSGPSQMELTDAAGGRFSQEFTQGYIAREGAGDWQIILIDDGVRTPPGQEAGAVLSPVAEVPLRQIVQVHVLWRPSDGKKADNPAASNAAVTWYFLGTGAEQDENALTYQGSAFVAIDGDGPDYAALLRQGEMRLKAKRGDLRDPLGQTSLRGDLVLRRDDAVVANILRQLAAQSKHQQP